MTSAASTSSRTALSGDASGSRRSPGSTFQNCPWTPLTSSTPRSYPGARSGATGAGSHRQPTARRSRSCTWRRSSCSPRTSPPCSRTPCPRCRAGKSPPPLNGSPEQQPPLHGVSFGWLHDVVQRAMPASRQARPAGQSPCEVHPQWYPDPVPLGTQTVPDWFAASQTSQSSPLPQALSTLPGVQVPSLQQPPWQMEWFASPHALSHWPVVVLQAMPIGQSPAPLHGHSPGVQHTPNFAGGAFAHRRLQQLWLVRQVPPSGLQLLASASRYPPRVSTTAAKRNAPRARCFIATSRSARKQCQPLRLLQDARPNGTIAPSR